jgi:hypothetical protein
VDLATGVRAPAGPRPGAHRRARRRRLARRDQCAADLLHHARRPAVEGQHRVDDRRPLHAGMVRQQQHSNTATARASPHDRAPAALPQRPADTSPPPALCCWLSAVLSGRFGITCNATGSVTGLSLNGNGLAGPFPDASVWSALSGLTDVSLTYNSISGSMIPITAVGAALTSIQLQANPLTGVLPTIEWLRCPMLSQIYIANTQIGGPLPKEIGQLVHLSVLIMSVLKSIHNSRVETYISVSSSLVSCLLWFRFIRVGRTTSSPAPCLPSGLPSRRSSSSAWAVTC